MREPVVCEVRVSHPDRVVYASAGLTKLDVVRYYAAIGDWMLPHVVDRPLTLVHCPNGADNECRYLRHGKAWGPAVRRVRIRERTKVGEYMVIDDVKGLVSLAQFNMLEIHTWNSRTRTIERPDRLVFDLDPGANVTWRDVADAARLLRSALEVLDLASWVKTTGGAGLHVVVPIRPEHDWPPCLAFARGLAQRIERQDPSRFTTMFRKAGRDDQILIDYLRNNRTNTSIAAFSTRARPEATVSMPIRWSDLGRRPEAFTIRTALARVRRRTDPWREYWTSRQHLSDSAVRAVSA